LAEYRAGDSTALFNAIGVVFSRGAERHRATVPKLDGSATFQPGRAGRETVWAATEEEGLDLTPLRVDMWGRRWFDVEGVTSHVPQIDGRVTRTSEGITHVVIENKGDTVIPPGVVISGHSGQRWLGKATSLIPAGSRLQVEIRPNSTVDAHIFNWDAVRSLSRRKRWATDCHLAFFVHDRFRPSHAGFDELVDSLFLQPSKLSASPWPAIESDSRMDTVVDCRTLVVWLPMDRPTTLKGMALRRHPLTRLRHYEESKTLAPTEGVWTVYEFSVAELVLDSLRVNVRYASLPKDYRLQIYDYRRGAWLDISLPRKAKVARRARGRWDKSEYAKETTFGDADRFVARPSGIVALRDSLPPSAASGRLRRPGERLIQLHAKTRAARAK